MKMDWPEVPLGNFLTERRVSPDEAALLSGVQPIISKIRFSDGGMEFRTSGESKTNLISIYPGDLVLSGINAVKGAIALYEPSDSTKAAATIHYSSYSIDQEQVSPKFLWLLLRHTVFSERLSQHVPNGIKTELKAKKFLPIPVPIPPLPEQRRIVATLDKIAARAKEAKKLAGQIEEEQELLLDSQYRESLKQGATKILMRDCVSQARRAVVINDEIEYKQVTVSMHFKGVFQRQVVLGKGIKTKQQYLAKSGDFIFSRIDARNGAFGFVPKELDGAIVTGDFPCFEVNEFVIKKEVLGIVLKTPQFVQSVLDASRGVTNRRRFKEAQLLGIEIEVPSMAEQEKIASISAKLWKSRTIHQQTAASLEALMPALLDQAFRGEL